MFQQRCTLITILECCKELWNDEISGEKFQPTLFLCYSKQNLFFTRYFMNIQGSVWPPSWCCRSKESVFTSCVNMHAATILVLMLFCAECVFAR